MKNDMKNDIAVLLVEDNEGHAQLVQRALARGGGSYDVQWVQSMRNALAALISTRVDIVLSDLTLPDSQGVDTVAALRNQQRHLPLVVLTSLSDDAVAMAALDHGAQDYLVKDGMTPENLHRTIRYAIQRQNNLIEIERLLTELRLAQSQLEKKNRRLAKLCRTAHRFVDNVSHEFRTPLTVIKEYGSLLRDGLLGDVNDEQQRFLDVLNDRSDDLNRMVDDMLDVSKLGAGILGICRCNCQLRNIVRRLQPGLARKAVLKNIDFQIDIDQDIPPVYADPEKVGRVIINLVVNAFKFCGEPGMVRLSASQPATGKQVKISVSDNGVGIRPDDLRKIFRRFKQLETGVRASTKGFGLGLSIARIGRSKFWQDASPQRSGKRQHLFLHPPAGGTTLCDPPFSQRAETAAASSAANLPTHRGRRRGDGARRSRRTGSLPGEHFAARRPVVSRRSRLANCAGVHRDRPRKVCPPHEATPWKMPAGIDR